MLECRTVQHPVSPVPDCKKLTMLELVWYRTKLTQSGIFLVRYQMKIWDAGMPMPALVSSVPMPSYAVNPLIFGWSTNSTDKRKTASTRNLCYSTLIDRLAGSLLANLQTPSSATDSLFSTLLFIKISSGTCARHNFPYIRGWMQMATGTKWFIFLK